jgi:hypothetical protein
MAGFEGDEVAYACLVGTTGVVDYEDVAGCRALGGLECVHVGRSPGIR